MADVLDEASALRGALGNSLRVIEGLLAEIERLRTLMHFAWDYHPHSRVRREGAGLPVLLASCVCASSHVGAARCRFCADRVRSQFPTPTWAEVEK